jgi:chaperonin GroEL
VPGGGVALLRCLAALDGVKTEGDDEATGVAIVRKALESPAYTIAANAGYEGAVVVKNILAKKGAWGFDADKGKYCDMIKAGIVDPTKVARCALQNAASVAGLLITTDACVATKPQPKDEGGHQHGPPGGMGM